jgi:hypothetical protein
LGDEICLVLLLRLQSLKFKDLELHHLHLERLLIRRWVGISPLSLVQPLLDELLLLLLLLLEEPIVRAVHGRCHRYRSVVAVVVKRTVGVEVVVIGVAAVGTELTVSGILVVRMERLLMMRIPILFAVVHMVQLILSIVLLMLLVLGLVSLIRRRG